jgi:hypothetical protein
VVEVPEGPFAANEDVAAIHGSFDSISSGKALKGIAL